MKLIYFSCLLVALSSVVAAGASGNYEKIVIEPNGKPYPGLKRGPKSEILASGKTGRIVGGQYAAPEQLPYQIYLIIGFGTSTYALCGGTLIGNEWIITAAHCTSGGQTFEVRLGSINRDTPLRVSWGYQNHIHPDYGTRNGDIALVKIQWVDYNVNMAPAALPPLNGPHSQYINERVVASGWGATDDQGGSGSQLKYVVMRVMDPEQCAQVYGQTGRDASILCTDTKNVGGTCSGDSGGSLVLENTRLLVGVTTFVAAAGCTVGLPDGFSRVTYYLTWIRDVSGISW